MGVLIIQTLEGFFDRKLVTNIAENPYMQFLIGKKCFEEKESLNPSLPVHFRERMGKAWCACKRIEPGRGFNGQDEVFLDKWIYLISMGRSADDEVLYKAKILFFISDTSSYMMGAIILVDGGRTVW